MEAPQVEIVDPGVDVVGRLILRPGASGELRQPVHGVRYVGLRHVVELVGRKNRDRRWRLIAITDDTRARDDDFLNTFGGLRPSFVRRH